MVIDSSALVAILLREPERSTFLEAMAGDPRRILCAAHLLESLMVIEARKGPDGARDLDRLIYDAKIQVMNLTPEVAEGAHLAWRRWGKGRHPAGLNYCDCIAYALSQQLGEALLCKGADLRLTDVQRAV